MYEGYGMEKPEVLFARYLSERKIPMTQVFKSVCEAAFDIHDHFSLDELSARFNDIDNKQVEAVLVQLECAGLVRKVIFREVEVFYEHVYGHLHHDHMHCVSCGKIIEFTDPTIELSQKDVAENHGFKMLRHTLRIEGICKDCQARSEEHPVAPHPETAKIPEMPLSMAANGERYIIGKVRGGKDLFQRLASMGVTQGDEIEVIQNTFAGPVTIRAKDSRIAIGHGMSHKIYVKPKP